MNDFMAIAKKNLVSILCGVVAIVAIVAWFWPVGAMYEALAADVNASKKKYDDVVTLHKQQRKLPSLVLENEQQDVLDRFPNDKVITAGQEATKALTEQSKKMLQTVSDLNVRTPLVPGSLPRANSKARSDFPDAYLTHLGQTEAGWKTGLPQLMRATEPPTREDLDVIAQKIWDEKFKIRIISIAGQTNEADVGAEFAAEVMDLPVRERQKRATENLIYLDPDSIPPSPDIQLGVPPTDVQIWFAQTALWVAEDVVAAINEANKGAKSVLDAPVKHLVSFRVPFGPDQYVLPAAAPGAVSPEGGPPPLTLNANGVPEYFNLSPTGRVSNPIYDVIHFDLVLRVDFRKIPQVLAELERNRLFTVLQTNVAAIDSAQELKAHGYVYGNDPVAEITIQGEALFLRSWTVDKDSTPPYKSALMPELVRQTVGAQEGPGLGGAGMQFRPGATGPPTDSMEQ